MSDTDTEVIAHLVAASTADTLEAKLSDALAAIDGTYGVAVMHADFPDRIVVARNGSPLIVGVGDHEMFVASDLAALVRHTTTVAHLDDGELATVTATGFTTYREDLTSTGKEARELDVDPAAYDAGEHASFMHKEILEQPEAAERMLRGRLEERFGTAHLGGLNMDARDTRAIRRVKVLGCGSAYYVGQMGASLIEELARIPADAEAASEFRYRNPIIEPDTLYVAVSQSGETIDTLLAVQEIRRKGGRVDRPGQRRRQRDRAGVRRRHLPARRTRGGGRVDEGAHQHVPRASRCSPCSSAGCGTCRSPTASG